MVYDTFLCTIGTRSERPYDRLFLEDSQGRLSRNGFIAHTSFNATPRPGLGLVLTSSVLGDYTVTPRRGGALLSLEKRGLADLIRSREVRARFCVKSIVLMPCLRAFRVARPVTEVWRIAGQYLTASTGTVSIATVGPMRITQTPLRIEAELTTMNVVFATEIIGNAKPAEVILSGERLMQTVGAQFLAAIGYTEGEGVWRR